jgi:hypothetical protein
MDPKNIPSVPQQAALLSFKNNIQYAAVTVVVTDASGAAVADLAALATIGGLSRAYGVAKRHWGLFSAPRNGEGSADDETHSE